MILSLDTSQLKMPRNKTGLIHSASSGSKLFKVTNYGPVSHHPNDPLLTRGVVRRCTDPSSPFTPNYDVYLRKYKETNQSPNDTDIIVRFDEDEVNNDVGADQTDDLNAQDLNANVVVEDKPPVNISDVEKGHPVSSVTVKRSRWRETWKTLAKRGRIMAKKHRRIIGKNGACNIHFEHVEKRRLRMVFDMFTTLLEAQWRYIFLFFFFTFCFTWIVFALIWWALYAIRKQDDMECIIGVFDFTTALLFSIETQHTIGYGTRSVTDVCPSATFLLMLQSTVGALTQCVVTGLVFAKLARPTRRAATVLFSRNAVICQQEGSMVLMFRVGDMRRTQVMGTTINAIFFHTRTTVDGDIISYTQKNLAITTISEDSFFFLAWPIKVMHKITPDSPLWGLSAEDLHEADFEIIVILEAAAETTGGGTQVRTSYLPSEILWGHKLAPLFTKHKSQWGKKSTGSLSIDFTQFDKTVEADTPEEWPPANLVARKDSYQVTKARNLLQVVNEI